MTNPLTLRSSLDAEQILQRIRAFGNRPLPADFNSYGEGKEVVARADKEGFWLWVSSPQGVQNAYRPVLYVRVEDEASGSLLRCQFTLHAFASAFLWLWFAILFVIQFVLVVAAVEQSRTGVHYLSNNPALTLIGSLLFGLIGGSMLRFLRWLNRSDKDILLSFIERTLHTSTVNLNSA